MNILLEPDINTNLLIEPFYALSLINIIKDYYRNAEIYLSVLPEFLSLFDNFKSIKSAKTHSAFGIANSYINYPTQIIGSFSQIKFNPIETFDNIFKDKMDFSCSGLFDIYISTAMEQRCNMVKIMIGDKRVNAYLNVFNSIGLDNEMFFKVVPKLSTPLKTQEGIIQICFADLVYLLKENIFESVIYNDDVIAHSVCLSNVKKISGNKTIDINNKGNHYFRNTMAYLNIDSYDFERKELL